MRSEEELKRKIATKLMYKKSFLFYRKLMADFNGPKVSIGKK